MTKNLKLTHKDLIEEALSQIETLSSEDAFGLEENEEFLFVDLRDPRELERGKDPWRFSRAQRHAGVLGRLFLALLQRGVWYRSKSGVLLSERVEVCSVNKDCSRHGAGKCLPPR